MPVVLDAAVKRPNASTVKLPRVYEPAVTAVLGRATVRVPDEVIGLPVTVRFVDVRPTEETVPPPLCATQARDVELAEDRTYPAVVEGAKLIHDPPWKYIKEPSVGV
jgi:hypothetical protein